jgi:hypothetical protein
LRRKRYFPESVKARLRVPGDEFTLDRAGDQWRIHPVRYYEHTVTDLDGRTNVWTVNHEFDEQAPKLRIQALQTTESYDSDRALLLTDFSDVDSFTTTRRSSPLLLPDWKSTGLFPAQPGRSRVPSTRSREGRTGEIDSTVLPKLEPSQKLVAGRLAGGLYSATNKSSHQLGWSCLSLPFSPAFDLRGREAIGLWVLGDGKGEVLNFQLAGREMRMLADHYVIVDFLGWRYFQLVEPEGRRYFDFLWPYPDRLLLFGTFPYQSIAWLNLFYTNIPAGETVACYLSPIKALPRTAAKLENPTLTINGSVLRFPATLSGRSYIELHNLNDCRLYSADGELIRKIRPQGDRPRLVAGNNNIRFDCRSAAGWNPRARVTIVGKGTALQ